MRKFHVWGDDLFITREDYGLTIISTSPQAAAETYARQEHATASGTTPDMVWARDPDGVCHEFTITEERIIRACAAT